MEIIYIIHTNSLNQNILKIYSKDPSDITLTDEWNGYIGYIRNVNSFNNIIAITTFSTITLISIDINGHINEVAQVSEGSYMQANIIDNILYCTRDVGAILFSLFDISDFGNVLDIGDQYLHNGDSKSTAISDSIMAVLFTTGDPDEGVAQSHEIGIYNIANIENFRELSRIQIVLPAWDGFQLEIENGFLYLCNRWEGLKVFNMFDPTNPFLAGYFDTKGFSRSMKVINGSIYIADGGGGTYYLENMLGGTIETIPNSISDTLYTGGINSYNVTIRNVSDNGVLSWGSSTNIANANDSSVTFVKQDWADWTLAENQDRISSDVWITRQNNMPIFNIAVENTAESGCNSRSPIGTLWSDKPTHISQESDYTDFIDMTNCYPPSIINETVSLWIPDINKKWDVIFDSWTSGGDGGGFSYTRNPSNMWGELNPTHGSVQPDDSLVTTLDVDFTGAIAGSFLGSINISHSDNSQDMIEIPLEFFIIGAPDISVNNDTVNFGLVYNGYSDTTQIMISNPGTDTLNITDVVVTPNDFSVNYEITQIAPNESILAFISFSPIQTGNFSSILGISSNDPDEGIIEILINGFSLEPPIINVTPDSLSNNLLSGESDSTFFNISNVGNSELVFSISSALNSSTRDDATPNIRRAGNLKEDRSIDDIFDFMSRDQTNYYPSEAGSQEYRNSRTERLLYTDPDEVNMEYDIGSVFDDSNQDLLVLKFQMNAIPTYIEGIYLQVLLDTDQNINTGYFLSEEIWPLGIDLIFIFSLYDGNEYESVYAVYDEEENDFYEVGPLSVFQYDNETGEIYVGIEREIIGETQGINFGALFEFGEAEFDWIPDLGLEPIVWEQSPSWLSFEPREGNISAGGSQDINLIYNTESLIGGEYHAELTVNNNDPANSQIVIPVTLSVIGIPMYSGPDSLNMGVSYVGFVNEKHFNIYNPGTDILQIVDLVTSDDQLQIATESTSIPPFDSVAVVASLLGTEVGAFNVNVSFSTNDVNNATVIVPVISFILEPPVVSTTVDSLWITFQQDTVIHESFQILNSGESELNWHLELIDLSGWQSFSKANYADWTQPEYQDFITDDVIITRQNNRPIYNIAQESDAQSGCSSDSPVGTLWSPMPVHASAMEDYVPFIVMTDCSPPEIIGDSISMWIENSDMFFDIIFSQWTAGGNGGGFSYSRTRLDPPWLSVSPMEGSTEPGEFSTLIVEINTELMDSDFSDAEILLRSNDPANPEFSIYVKVDTTNLGLHGNIQLPEQYALHQNYPNPFNPSTFIRYDLPEEGIVRIEIYDLLGRHITTLVNEHVNAGYQSVIWYGVDQFGKSVGSGMYFYQIHAGEYVKTRKMILLK